MSAYEVTFETMWEQMIEDALDYTTTCIDGVTSNDSKRFFALALCGEAGEFANLVKKEWRDDVDKAEEAKDEIADVLAYTMACAASYDMTPQELLDRVNKKHDVFIQKMIALRS